MGTSTFIILSVLAVQTYSAPQFISVKDGKLGVNFGGYHAGVGIGGLLGGGAGGGLFAEAGTPTGQAARAGLGGAVGDNGHSSGGLYAGATAGGNVKAEAGLSGGVAGEKTAGVGFANAQAGNRFASSGLGGETAGEAAHGFSYSGSTGISGTKSIIKETEVAPVEIVRPTYKKVHKEFQFDAANEVVPTKNVELHTSVVESPPPPPAPVVKEVSRPWYENRFGYTHNYESSFNFGNFLSSLFRFPEPMFVERPWWEQQPSYLYRPNQVVYQPVVVEKHIVRTKPRHHFRKTAYVGGYIGGGGGVAPPAPAPVVPQPVIEKRVDVVNQGVEHDSAGAGQVAYTKQFTYQRNPTFFADIFNIPIQTLKAVGNFLGNTAGSTSVSVQKSASVQADSDGISPKHSSGASAASDTHLSIQTPNVSKVIDDVFAIPINTLSAVNKFLENNVPARKKVTVDSTGEPSQLRVRPHARRRNKHIYVINEQTPASAATEEKEESVQ